MSAARQAPIAPAAARNAAAILGVLRHELRHARSVLEIGSGTGQHAAAFAVALPSLSWQTSELPGQHAAIEQHIALAGLDNLPPPLELDVRVAQLTGWSFDAVFTCNTAHIMAIDAVERMLGLAGEVLSKRGRFCCYGPFRRNGGFNTPSNAAFDRSLRQQDAAMGIRDLEVVDEFAAAAGLVRRRVYAMPANNLIAVWEVPE